MIDEENLRSEEKKGPSERLSYEKLQWALDQLDFKNIMCCLFITLSREYIWIEA